jgi:gamma-glutamylcyclotransferase (GGCT)/AIG2-like uncharacterized protein YtfP
MATVKYFAYGSNMDPQAMTAVAPSHRDLGIACLPDHRLAFTRRSIRTHTGVADVVASPGHAVWGVLYELDDDDLSSVDRKEGFDWAYIRSLRTVLPEEGAPVEALVYSVREKEPHEIRPSADYARRVLEAARARGLAAEYLEQLRTAIAGGSP